MVERVVVVGTGVGGAGFAASLREQGYEGEIVVLGEQRHHPYELPALSKQFLLGEAGEPDWVRAGDFYRNHDIDLRTGVWATECDRRERVLIDSVGRELSYDRLVLATGMSPRRLPVPGAELRGIHVLRTLDDAVALRDALTSGVRVAIVGAGWIGCEVAAVARQRGAEVTVMERDSLPLRGVLGDTVAAMFRDLHAEHGVRWYLESGVDGFTSDGHGHVRSVRLGDGRDVPAEVVVLAVGARPRVDLAEQVGLEPLTAAPGGVPVDEYLRTSLDGVYALGDLAAHQHPLYGQRLRVEHWSNAKEQGEYLARAFTGSQQSYRQPPFFFSDQYDLGMEYRGFADPHRDELVVRGDLDEREFLAFWLREGRVRAAMNVNSWDEGDQLAALVERQQRVESPWLRDGDLAALAAG